MTTLNEAKQAILNRFSAMTSLAAADWARDNETYDPGDRLTPNAPWARVSIRHTSGAQGSLGRPGNRKFNARGTVFVQIMTTSDSGTSAGDLLAQETRDIFRGTSFDGLRFTNVDIREVPEGGSWWVTLVEAPFDYQETK